MKKYFVFKLNLGPDIIDTYNDMEQLKIVVIPNNLKQIFQHTELSNSLKLTSEVEYKDFRKSELFDTFNTLSDQHEEEYLKIVSEFKETGGFGYTADYQKMNTEFGLLLNKIYKEFPYLKEVSETRDDDLTHDLEFKVGTGRKYVESNRKIKKYLRDNIQEQQSRNFNFYYESTTEYIYINSAHKDAINLANIIQEEINTNRGKNEIGEVSINPISEKVEVIIKQKSAIKEVSFHYVYPNGKKDVNNRNEAIKKLKAEKERVTYLTNSKNGFSPDDIQDIAEEKSKKGYLSDVLHKGRSIINWIQKEVLKEFE
jgi:hypothetical protein